MRSLAIGLSAGLCGLLLGATGTVLASGDAPPAKVDPALLDSIAAQARDQGRSDAETELSARIAAQQDRLASARAKYADLTSQLASTSQDAAAAQRMVDKLREELTTVEQELADLAATPPSRDRLRPGSPPIETSPVIVTGTLKSSWVLSSRMKPWPTGCSGAQDSYQVRVKDGAGATVALAPIVANRVAARSEKNGILTLTCMLTYEAQFGSDGGSVYEFVAIDKSAPNKELKAALIPVTQLMDGTGPELYVSFCPEC